jgi:hypothetical protein
MQKSPKISKSTPVLKSKTGVETKNDQIQLVAFGLRNLRIGVSYTKFNTLMSSLEIMMIFSTGTIYASIQPVKITYPRQDG